MLSILLGCCAVILCVTAQTRRTATVYILPASDSAPPAGACPGEPCLTIDQYVSNSSLRDGITDIIMELQPGYHNLSVPFSIDGTINTDVSSIAMNGEIGRDVTLLCTEEFTFTSIDSVRISGINLINCGGLSTHIANVQNFTLEDSTFQSDMPFRLRSVTYPIVVNSVFLNCTSSVLSIEFGRPMIRNCTFSNNVKRRVKSLPGDIDGGVIYLYFLNAFIDQCTFVNNTAMFTSGAIYVNNAELSVTNSSFFNNSAVQSDGGAIFSIDGSISIQDSSFTNNSAGQDGGSVYITGEEITIAIEQCDFFNNTAGFEGGAIQIAKRNQDTSRRLYTRIDNNRFIGNSASRGGAIVTTGSNIFFGSSRCLYADNSGNSTFDGPGALFLIVGRAEIVVNEAVFSKNRGYYGAISLTGGGDYSALVLESNFTENAASNRGGAIFSERNTGNFTISSCEFNRNSAPQCGAVDFNTGSTTINTGIQGRLNVRILSSTFANNSATVGGGGALCASDVSLSISNLGFMPVNIFKRNTAVAGGGAISTTNSALIISRAAFSDNSARSGGDAIHACSSEVNVESSDGLLGGRTDGQCLLFSNNGTSNGGISSYYYAVNLPLFSFVTMMLLSFMLC